MRILRNSGLKTESERHMDVLYSTVERAAGKLKADDLEEQLAALLKMDRTIAAKGEQGNACMVAALVLTVAVLVQTRLEAGKGLHNIDVEPLAEIGTSSKASPKSSNGRSTESCNTTTNQCSRSRGTSCAT